MKTTQDAYGQQLLEQYNSKSPTSEIIERDDGYIDTGSDPGRYFSNFKQWSPTERNAIKFSKGRVLDIGCGAGRHSIYLQQKGFEVTGIDNSPGAVKVCKLRGLERAYVKSIADVGKFKPESFDTVIMLGNNFGLFGGFEAARETFKKLFRITTADARIIAGTLNPYKTENADHLQYHKLNRKRGRMPGQIKMRVRFRKAIGEWFDYLFVSPQEMEEILSETNWQIEKLIAPEEANYFAIFRKN